MPDDMPEDRVNTVSDVSLTNGRLIRLLEELFDDFNSHPTYSAACHGGDTPMWRAW